MTTRLKNFIDGRFVESAGTEVLDIVSPVTGDVVAQAPVSTQEEVDQAFDAAQRAFATWRRTTPGER